MEDPLHPSERLVAFYKEKLRECRSDIADLRRDVEACQRLAEESSTKEENAVRILSETSALQENLSELQSCLYQEREHVLRLKKENDQLQIERFENKKKIAFLLHAAGIKESELSLEDRGRKILGMAPRKRVRFREVKNFNKSIEEFKEESQIEILQLKVNALEEELKQQTTLLKDELIAQTSDFTLRIKEWEVQKKRLMQQITCLSCRLRNAQQFKFSELHACLEQLDIVRDRDLKLIEENDKLKRSLAICKELLGTDRPDEKLKKKEYNVIILREQIEQRDEMVRKYMDQNAELMEKISQLKTEMANEKEMRQKDKERLVNREEYFKRKMEEERKRRLLDAEGFAADVKLLRSKLLSVERQIRQDKLRKRHQKDC